MSKLFKEHQNLPKKLEMKFRYNNFVLCSVYILQLWVIFQKMINSYISAALTLFLTILHYIIYMLI